ncbi:hypothetical protein [Natrinema halophilum]|uniref:Uncharacterized protein n=1 Tax=Natrinema halophilum TaxID=1699371 RepID=A0A7D5GHS4_9EURY|nr:hypothetical protein [Natrinema halophilum]QLG49354.1 hypothetical protein HYG82_11010 [Natrinema halophilum]
MSTQHLTRPEPDTDPESTLNRTTTRPAPSSTVTEDPRTATDLAPRTFPSQNRARLENLIDEWNAGFASGTSDEAA